jgi:hypothetical protein
LTTAASRSGDSPAELLAADLSGLDLVALMVGGVHFWEHTCVVTLGIAASTAPSIRCRWSRLD